MNAIELPTYHLTQCRFHQNLKTTTIDLETAQARLANALAESESRAAEIDKLRIFKAMVKQGMEREESLKTKVGMIMVYIYIAYLFLMEGE